VPLNNIITDEDVGGGVVDIFTMQGYKFKTTQLKI
jgi:hypothetical protein